MSFSLDTRNTKYLHNYEAALKHHDNVTPIRNSNCRPMAERRKQHFNIRKHGETVIVRLHTTDIVAYTPDNRIVLDMGRWNTNSTRAAMYAVTGVSITQQHSRRWVQDHDHKYYLFKDGMQLQADAGYRGPASIIDPIYPVIHTLNRKALNQKLRQFKDYYNYLLGVAKVDGYRGQGLVADSLHAMTNPDNYRGGLFAPEPETAFALACDIVSRSEFGGKDCWRFFVRNHNPDHNPTTGLNLESFISNTLKRALIKTHKDELLTKTTVTDGRIVKDQYGWV
jgi:hypothetical protein